MFKDSLILGQPVHGPHPDAPPQLDRFRFLVGDWTCEGEVLRKGGDFEPFTATMTARYILDGLAIGDLYRQYDSDGTLTHFGVTVRAFDGEKKQWVMRFHDALRCSWIDLGPPELGGVRFQGGRVVFQHHQPPSHLIRITFHGIQDDRFRWRGEFSSDDGKSYREGMRMTAERVKIA